jgi:hypothetical protein
MEECNCRDLEWLFQRFEEIAGRLEDLLEALDVEVSVDVPLGGDDAIRELSPVKDDGTAERLRRLACGDFGPPVEVQEDVLEDLSIDARQEESDHESLSSEEKEDGRVEPDRLPEVIKRSTPKPRRSAPQI